MPYIYNIL